MTTAKCELCGYEPQGWEHLLDGKCGATMRDGVMLHYSDGVAACRARLADQNKLLRGLMREAAERLSDCWESDDRAFCDCYGSKYSGKHSADCIVTRLRAASAGAQP